MCFQRKKRHALLTHQIRHIHPRHAHALTQCIVAPVDDVVQNARAKVGHTDLVYIRERERIADIHLLRILDDAVHLAAQIARRLLHLIQQRVDLFLKQASFEHFHSSTRSVWERSDYFFTPVATQLIRPARTT